MNEKNCNKKCAVFGCNKKAIYKKKFKKEYSSVIFPWNPFSIILCKKHKKCGLKPFFKNI